jgi:hypothetical protein
MTPVNLAKHRNNPNMPFWMMIKEGYDHFEITHHEPKVDFCEKKYVFDAGRAPNATHDPVFGASAKCPAYAIPQELADAAREKQQQDEAEYAKLVAKGTPVAKLNTGVDGGMHQIFASHVPGGSTGLSDGGEGQSLSLVAFSRAPGTIPGTVNPPHMPWQVQQDQPVVAVSAPAQAQAGTKVAAAAPTQPPVQESEGFFARLGRKMGIANADTTATATPAPVKSKTADAKPLPKAFKPVETKPAEIKQMAASRPPLKPSVTEASAVDRAVELVRQPLLRGEVTIAIHSTRAFRVGELACRSKFAASTPAKGWRGPHAFASRAYREAPVEAAQCAGDSRSSATPPAPVATKAADTNQRHLANRSRHRHLRQRLRHRRSRAA